MRCTCGMWMKTKMTRESGRPPMAGIPGRNWMTAASRTAEISPVGAGLLRAATTWSLRRFPTVSRRRIFTREQSTSTSARSAVCLQCSGTGQGTFLNLTHVYGCAPNFASIAHVHPDQHDLDFMVANSKAILYFANDGGIYRALDGYSGLTTGD